MLHDVSFFSQVGGQNSNIGCGSASVMMLLRHHELPIRVPSYSDLCQCLWLTVDPEIKGYDRAWGRGAYVNDVEPALQGLASPDDRHIHFQKIKARAVEKALPISEFQTHWDGVGFYLRHRCSCTT
jgi:hypothetical protein